MADSPTTFGGYKPDRNTDAGDHWSLSLDESEAWQREADLPDPRGHVSAAVLDGNLYALGGDHGHDITQIDLASCHRFDPATNLSTAIASLRRDHLQPPRSHRRRPKQSAAAYGRHAGCGTSG